ncbi:MAG: stage V sporulation protein AA [Candidatus Limivivens sp.]|nr:stage V sporulation protein AA [Candidatus Limivivens sp.]
MREILYLKIDRNVQVHDREVFLKDIAQVTCESRETKERVKNLRIPGAEGEQPGRHAMSVMEIIEVIHAEFPELEIHSLGEADFIVTREKAEQPGRAAVWLKTAFVAALAFAGAAFTIMTFNNDVDIPKLFGQVFFQFTGQESDGFTVLEVSYSLGVGLGILIFFNHFAGRKLTSDPTPMEVEMRLYEDDVDSTLIEASSRSKKSHGQEGNP